MNISSILVKNLGSHFAHFSILQPNEERNVLEESAVFIPKGEITEPGEKHSLHLHIPTEIQHV